MTETFELACQKKYSVKTLRKEFSNLKKTGLIKLKQRYHKPYPILSRQGKLKIVKRKLKEYTVIN